MSSSVAGARSARIGRSHLLLLVAAVLGALVLPVGAARVHGDSPPDHLVISEVVTGGASASDELVELYNPTSAALPLEGLEVVYVSASGLTVSRRAAWEVGAPELGPGRHVLVANEAGLYAGIADVVYASGIAATGGSVALRIQGAASAIDAVGWGTATSTWLEGTPAPAPAAGASLERLPGGPVGSTQDTDDNAADFAERSVPDPQNLGSPAVPDPSLPPASRSPSPSPSPSLVPTSTPAPTVTPTAAADDLVPIATARRLPDGAPVTVEGTALTGSAFTDGGGYVADASGGIGALLASGAFERGDRVRVSGSVDDRFAQRTIRADAAGVTVLGPGADPVPFGVVTGQVGEPVEGVLVRIAGTIRGAPTTLSAGIAYEVDDGSGAARVLVGTATGIPTAAWTPGSIVDVIGVVGQRDSTGTGASGYRIQPRDSADVLAVSPPSPSPSPSATADPSASASASPLPDGVVSIAEARSRPKNAQVRVRGTVTMAPGVVDPIGAIIQDASGAILLRVGEEAGRLARGDRVEVAGTRSTLGGMETVRVISPAVRLGSGTEPAAAAVRTGDAGEELEARLIRVRGALVSSARRVASGTVSFEIDDGSGPLRVYLAATLGAATDGLVAGAWVEAVGPLGQETTGAQPLRGYRVWPRATADVRVVAAPTDSGGAGDDGQPSGSHGTDGHAGGGGSGSPGATLADVGRPGTTGVRIRATAVLGAWPELAIGGLLWDGERLVAVDEASAGALAGVIGSRHAPVPLELGGLTMRGIVHSLGIPLVTLGEASGDVVRADGPPHTPALAVPETGAAWVSIVGRLERSGERLGLAGTEASVRLRCTETNVPPRGTVRVTGIGVADPPRLLVPCGGVDPAPSLARDGDRADGSSATPTASPGAGFPSSAGEGLGRLLAGGLLAAGALVAASAGVVARRLVGARDPDPDGDPGDALVEPDLDEPEDRPGPPALTLVRVPHERGSP